MVANDDILRRMMELERSVGARLAEQEAQLRAIGGRTVPDGGAARAIFRAKRKAKRIPASVRRRVRAARRERRIAAERPVVDAAESQRRAAVVDEFLDPAPGGRS